MDAKSMDRYHARENAPYLISEMAAKMYTGRNWHTLTTAAIELVEQLVIGEYLTKTKDGFVGEVIH